MDSIEESLTYPRARYCFERRYGLQDGESQTLQVVADDLGVSRERIRQIVEEAIARIRRTGRSESAVACPRLLSYLQTAASVDDSVLALRLMRMASSELGHIPLSLSVPLLLSLLGVDKQRRVDTMAEVRREQQRARAAEQQERSLEAAAERRRAKEAVFATALETETFWPTTVRLDLAHPSGSKRSVRSTGDDCAELPTFYSDKIRREVQCESELEYRFLLQMDDSPSVRWYQEQPLSIEYEADGRTRLYYPDVLALLSDGRSIVIEIKPHYQMGLLENVRKWRAAFLFCEARGYGFLVTDGRHSLKELIERSVPSEFRRQMLATIEHGPTGWKVLREIRDSTAASALDMVSIVLQERLVLLSSPFRVGKQGS